MSNIHNVVTVQFSLIKPILISIYPYTKKILEKDERKVWFKYRSDLFLNTLYKSLQVQDKKVTFIFLLMDIMDHDFYFEFLNLPDIIPIFSPVQFWTNQVKKYLMDENLFSNITISRIDSDDILQKSFFKNISEQLINHPSKYINCTKGYVASTDKCQSIFYPSSPFWSIYYDKNTTKNELFQCKEFDLWKTPHSELKNVKHTQIHNAEFIQIVHGSNLSNNFYNITSGINQIYCEPIKTLDLDWFENWSGFKFPNLTCINKYEW